MYKAQSIYSTKLKNTSFYKETLWKPHPRGAKVQSAWAPAAAQEGRI